MWLVRSSEARRESFAHLTKTYHGSRLVSREPSVIACAFLGTNPTGELTRHPTMIGLTAGYLRAAGHIARAKLTQMAAPV